MRWAAPRAGRRNFTTCLDQRLGRHPSAGGCDLPATMSWSGTLLVEQQFLQPVGVAQHQGQPLVRRDGGPCESDG